MCSYATLSPGDVNTEAWSTSLWLGLMLTPSLCKTTLVKKSQEMQAGGNANRWSSKNKCLWVGSNWKMKAGYRKERRSFVGAGKDGTGCGTNMMMIMIIIIILILDSNQVSWYTSPAEPMARMPKMARGKFSLACCIHCYPNFLFFCSISVPVLKNMCISAHVWLRRDCVWIIVPNK